MASALINSTISGLDVPVTLSSVFEEVTKYNVQLNIAERLWASWYLWMQNDTLATGILAFVMHEVVYFGRSLPFIIMELIPYFNKYKIQNQKIPTWKERFDCASLVLLSHFTVELPQIWLFHPFATMCGMEFGVPFPPAWKMAMQIAVFFVCEDAWHYWFHRALHYGPLYRNIHKLHHTYSAPFGMAAEYASPIETMLLGIGTVGVPIVWVAITKDLHLATMYVWIVMRLFQAVDAHSGYDFPWSLHNFLPFWAVRTTTICTTSASSATMPLASGGGISFLTPRPAMRPARSGERRSLPLFAPRRLNKWALIFLVLPGLYRNADRVNVKSQTTREGKVINETGNVQHGHGSSVLLTRVPGWHGKGVGGWHSFELSSFGFLE